MESAALRADEAAGRTAPPIPARQAPKASSEGNASSIGHFGILLGAGLVVTLLAVLLGLAVGFPLVLTALGLLILGGLILRRPVVGFYAVAFAAVAIDEGGISPALGDAIHLNLYVFYWPPALEGLIERPIGFLLLYIFAVLLVRRFALRQRLLEGGMLLTPFLTFILVVASGFIHGIAAGGDLKIAVVAIRPLWYLFLAYLLAVNVVTDRRQVRTFLWIVVGGIGAKALLGVYLLLVVYGLHLPDTESILSHEESFFFASALVLLLIQTLHARLRGQFAAALALSPLVILAMVANQRRAAYVALALGILVAWVLVIVTRPQARKPLIAALLVFVLLGAGYVAAFANSSSSLGAPARGLISAFYPTGEKANSNLYRDVENYDVKYTANQSPLFGIGFGKPFEQPRPLTDVYPGIQQADIYYNYIPHNNIYWILVSLGLLGYGALWYLFGSVIVRGGLLARRLRDPYLQAFAVFVVAVIFMEVTVAFADYQLFFFRNALFVGLLAGQLARLPALDHPPQETTQR